MNRDFWINQGFFQAAWPACVIGAAYGKIWIGLVVVGGMAVWQLRSVRRHQLDFTLVAICLGIGFVLDSLFVQLGILDYATAWPWAEFAPIWIMLLWVALALVINHSMRAFQNRLVLLSIFGGIGSPMSYFAGSRFGAVEWLVPAWQVILATGLSWAILLPALFWYAGQSPDESDPAKDQSKGQSNQAGSEA